MLAHRPAERERQRHPQPAPPRLRPPA